VSGNGRKIKKSFFLILCVPLAPHKYEGREHKGGGVSKKKKRRKVDNLRDQGQRLRYVKRFA
jgi:hypothetical protein